MLNRFAILSTIVCLSWSVALTGPAWAVALAVLIGAGAIGGIALMLAPPRPVAVGLLQDSDGRYCLPEGLQHIQAPPAVAYHAPCGGSDACDCIVEAPPAKRS